jgi:hypothetical protein
MIGLMPKAPRLTTHNKPTVVVGARLQLIQINSTI